MDEQKKTLQSLEEKIVQEQTQREGNIPAADLNFLMDSKEALLVRKTPYANAVLYVIAGIIATFLIWANFSKVDEIVKGQAKVASPQDALVIKNQNGGTLESILVTKGEHVNKDQPIAKLADNNFLAERDSLSGSINTLIAAIARLNAEATSQPIEKMFPAGFITQHPKEANLAVQEYNADMKELEDKVSSLNQTLISKKIILAETEALYKRDTASKSEYMRDKDVVTEIEEKISATKNNFRKEVQAKLTKANADLEEMKQKLDKAEYNLQLTTIRAPLAGIVDQIESSNVGSTVEPSTKIMTIAPDSAKLIFDTQIPPKDIAYVHKGDNVIIMLDTFPYAIYGSLKGKVTQVLPGLITDPNDPKHQYFKAIVEPDVTYVVSGGKKHDIVLNTSGQANIVTGKKTVMAYLLKPFTKARYNAMTER